MNSLIVVVIMFCANIGFAQNNESNSSENSGSDPVMLALRNYESGWTFNTNKKINGDIYVFKNWTNSCRISIGDKVYKLNNINLNIKTNYFEAKVGKDSIFTLNTSNADYIYINNRKFKSFNVPSKGRSENFELIYDGTNIKLLKGYELGVKYNEPDPLMVRKNVDTYYTTTTYYTKIGGDLILVKLKKKSLLSLFDDKANMVSKFAKNNKLSFKKERDVNKILIYYESL